MKGMLKRSRVSRIIASALALVMILSPFHAYSGFKNSTKAADSVPQFKIDSALSLGDIELVNQGSDLYGIAPNSSEQPIYYYSTGEAKFQFNGQISALGTLIIEAGEEEQEELVLEPEEYILDVKLVVCGAGDTPSEILTSTEGSFEFGANVSVAADCKVAIYVKPQVAGTELDEYSVVYTLQAVYAIQNVELLKIGSVWDNTPDDAIGWAQSATMRNMVSEAYSEATYVGKIQYAVAEYVDGKNAVTDYDLSWQESNLLTADTTGHHVGFVRYADDDGNTIVSRMNDIKIDATKPSIKANSIELQYSDDGATWGAVKNKDLSGETLMINPVSGRKYRYTLSAKDSDSGIDKVVLFAENLPPETWVEFTKIDGNYYAEINASQLLENKEYAFKAQAIDKAGNTSDQELPYLIKLANTGLVISSSFKINGEKVTVDRVYVNSTTNTLTISASSEYEFEQENGYLCQKVYNPNTRVYEDTNNIKCINFIQDIDPDTGKYKATFEFQIPSNIDQNKLLGYQFVVTDNGDRTKSKELLTMVYDNTKPTLEVKKAGTSFATDINTIWNKSYTVQYRITSGTAQTESESYLDFANYSIGDSSDKTPISVGDEATSCTGKINVPQSTSVKGTKITFNASDKAGNTIPNEDGANVVYVKVDSERPKVSGVDISVGDTYVIRGEPQIKTTLTDNLTLKEVKYEITYPGNITKTKKYTFSNDNNERVNIVKEHTLKFDDLPSGMKKMPDGRYTVKITAVDKAGNESIVEEKEFFLDNTLPEVTAKISAGNVGGKMPMKNYDNTDRDYYYKSGVTVLLTYKDDTIDVDNEDSLISVTDNGKPLNVNWIDSVASTTITAEGLHEIKISAIDTAGNQSEVKSIAFVVDTVAPKVNATVNGNINYTDTTGVLDLTSDSSVSVSVVDAFPDNDDLNYMMIKSVPDKPTVSQGFDKTSGRQFNFNEEADYTLSFYAIDKAGNQGERRVVAFRIDKTAPELSIAGASSGGTSANVSTVTFTMRELFWRDASGTVRIYRKGGDGSEETLLKTIDLNLTGFETSVSEILSDTGVYRMEFEASDRVGHHSTMSQTFTIDRDAPEIILKGVNNYDVTDKTVEYIAEIKDAFYSSKNVTVTGTRIDINGKVNNISFSSFNQSGNPTIISDNFSEDGIYDIEVSSTDIAGNSHSQKVHFTIDKTAPVIGSLSEYDGTIIKEFKWDKDLDELVTDLTVCDIHMYLNGSEYDGVSDIADGSYILLITAEDELGHSVEKSVSFVLDTKAPVFIVTGVEDGEVRNEAYNIGVSLQLDEDILQSVTLNDKDITITDNVASINVTEKGSYTLKMTASDEAGNISEETISFKYGEVSHWWVWLIIAICIALLAAIIVILIKKRKKK